MIFVAPALMVRHRTQLILKGKEVLDPDGNRHQYPIVSVRGIPSTRAMVTADAHGEIRMWDIDDDQQVRYMGRECIPGPAVLTLLSPGRRHLLAINGYGQLTVWRIGEGLSPESYLTNSRRVAFKADLAGGPFTLELPESLKLVHSVPNGLSIFVYNGEWMLYETLTEDRSGRHPSQKYFQTTVVA